ncbi:MAG: hypothetical protein HLUCCA24_00305, partial [Rhodobacteraceae bacterium HLUCCA24]
GTSLQLRRELARSSDEQKLTSGPAAAPRRAPIASAPAHRRALGERRPRFRTPLPCLAHRRARGDSPLRAQVPDAPLREQSLRSLYCSSDGLHGRGAAVTTSSDSASFHSCERITPSSPGIKHDRGQLHCPSRDWLKPRKLSAVLSRRMATRRATGVPRHTLDETFEHAMKFPARHWQLLESAVLALKKTVLRLASMEPLPHCRNEGLRTPDLSFPFKALDRIFGQDCKMAHRGGFEPPTP